MSNNPYIQAALTYLRRPLASWPGRVLIVGWIPAIVFASALVGRRRDADFTWLMIAFMFLCILSAIHMVQQFADSRAYLTPAFRHVHIAVAAVVALVIALLLPAILTWLLGFRSIGLVASAMFLFGTFLCTLLYPSAWVGWLMPVGIIAICTPWGKGVLYQFVSGRCELQALGLFIVGVMMTLLGGVRLFQMNEDMPGYHTWNAIGTKRMMRPWAAAGAMPSRDFAHGLENGLQRGKWPLRPSTPAALRLHGGRAVPVASWDGSRLAGVAPGLRGLPLFADHGVDDRPKSAECRCCLSDDDTLLGSTGFRMDQYLASP